MIAFNLPSWARFFIALSSGPLSLSRSLFPRPPGVPRVLSPGLPLAGSATTLPPATAAALQWHAMAVQTMIDQFRHQYATAVRAGWVQRSMLASATFEHRLMALERLTLGPLARAM